MYFLEWYMQWILIFRLNKYFPPCEKWGEHPYCWFLMKTLFPNKIVATLALVLIFSVSATAQKGKKKKKKDDEPAVPVFVDGQAQIVDGFKKSSDWIRHDLWVITEFDSDGDGKMDRMHVSVTRPKTNRYRRVEIACCLCIKSVFRRCCWKWPRCILGCTTWIGRHPTATQTSGSDQNGETPDHFQLSHQQMGSSRLHCCALFLSGNRPFARCSDGWWRKRIFGAKSGYWLVVWTRKRIYHTRRNRRSCSQLVHRKSGHDGNFIQRNIAACCSHNGCRRLGSDHPNCPEHFLLSLLPFQRFWCVLQVVIWARM